MKARHMCRAYRGMKCEKGPQVSCEKGGIGPEVSWHTQITMKAHMYRGIKGEKGPHVSWHTQMAYSQTAQFKRIPCRAWGTPTTTRRYFE